MTLAPGEYVIVWADEEPGEGDLHAPFKLDADGEDVYLTDGAVIIDQVTFPALAAERQLGPLARRHRRLGACCRWPRPEPRTRIPRNPRPSSCASTSSWP